MNSNARKLAEQDEKALESSGVPYTIIRSGALKNAPGGKQGFSFKEVLSEIPQPVPDRIQGCGVNWKQMQTYDILNFIDIFDVEKFMTG